MIVLSCQEKVNNNDFTVKTKLIGTTCHCQEKVDNCNKITVKKKLIVSMYYYQEYVNIDRILLSRIY